MSADGREEFWSCCDAQELLRNPSGAPTPRLGDAAHVLVPLSLL